jgi:hypothetical protein
VKEAKFVIKQRQYEEGRMQKSRHERIEQENPFLLSSFHLHHLKQVPAQILENKKPLPENRKGL